ncbi:PepSY domain-containing protein [Brevibacillus sp. HB1.2]|uniref:PepSY-associated TM helix domain-containing protein n=1 Tax=Brevibacillus TaxID=55080 RepID=UPI000380BF31|nr:MULTISPECIES: PepSY-associated TM helix domain-containing protein [unclassified Brevibacillus]ATF10823.1 PepSY domain-containing protein [Brevibacillus brevis X23]MDC0764729.1 PepSY-associated TM helix domain-containing protein [Brevibacillus sp. AG]NRS20460.1 PepSY domain-containing protein [Brevibacillus sp. HB1.4B]NTU24031.1 PepSY domain-containing protein [Brevibacillus sp. HB1.2]NTU34020.1 PepSY domain-containing protein [Brevibacillus sp. HB1.1]
MLFKKWNRNFHRYIGLIVSLFLLMWAITGFLLLNVPWYQEKATDLKTTMIEVPAKPEELTIAYVGEKLVETGEYSWAEIRSIAKSGDSFKVYVSREPILRLTVSSEGHITALKQDPILDFFYGLHVGEWEDLNYVTVLEIISILTAFLVVSGLIYFLPKRWFKKRETKI